VRNSVILELVENVTIYEINVRLILVFANYVYSNQIEQLFNAQQASPLLQKRQIVFRQIKQTLLLPFFNQVAIKFWDFYFLSIQTTKVTDVIFICSVVLRYLCHESVS
jgi:hypothetical protein